ncbi:MAG: ATP-dependent RecD-like DNA helicase [Clostridia bacterium]
MEISGQIADIIYQNEMNSYMIAIFILEEEIAERIGEEETTVVGYLPFINSGDSLRLTGKFVEHKEYGRQFKIETFEKLMPQTVEALERYLANGTIKGIGPATARRIVETFGEETISIFKFEPYKLAQVKGISKERALEVAEEFNSKWNLWQIVSYLEKFGIGANHAKKIYDTLGIEAINEIENNPYILSDIVRGVDFRKIDKIATDLGFEYNSPKRIESGIKYSLNLASYNGNVCVIKENLMQYAQDLLKVTEDDIDTAMINLSAREEIVIEKRETIEEWVYLAEMYQAEHNIAHRIHLLEKAQNIKEIPHILVEIEKIEKDTGVKLSSKQKEAIKEVNNHNVCIITGGPGTGKTTIIKSIIEMYKKRGKKVVLCAPTGRAAKKMTETTGEEAKTLHRLLEIGKFEDDGLIQNDYEVSPIDADIVVVDEVSMVDVFLMNYLLSAIYQGTKLVLVGDVDQLPSVGPGSVLKDMIASETITTVSLNKIFRQAAKSKIIVNAHKVNKGQSFIHSVKEEIEDVDKEDEDIIETLDDFFYIREYDLNKILQETISLCQGRLQNYGDYDFFSNIQILTPTKKGILGTKELNKALQKALNPKTEEKKEKSYGGVIFREGDRVMQIKNNYDMFWEKKEPIYENGSGVFNGELGRIEKIDEEDKQIKVKYDDGKIAWYTFSELDQMEHSYAITIHKAQGSEFDVVILVVSPSSSMLLTRNLLYTALTRAKKLLVVLGSDRIIDFMVQNADLRKRNTGLEYKLRNIE